MVVDERPSQPSGGGPELSTTDSLGDLDPDARNGRIPAEDFGDPSPVGEVGKPRLEPMAQTQSRIAYALLGLLGGVLLVAWVSIMTHEVSPTDVREVLTDTLPALVALVGAVTGFYYGDRRR